MVLNPVHAGAGAARAELAKVAQASGIAILECQTSVADPGPGQARRALDAGADGVVVVGGDGTLRHVAGALAGSGVPLGIVPTGTANLFARNVGLSPARLHRNVRVALAGDARPVDLGWARLDGAEEQPFLVLAGIGHDAATVLATRARLKRRLRWLAYFEAGARYVLQAPVAMRVAADGRPVRELATWCVLVANCGRLPGGVRVFPDARPDDGELDTLAVTPRRPLDWALVAATGLLHLRRPVGPLTYGRARTVTVRPDEPQPCQLDGDAVARVSELNVRVAPGALTVHVPPTKGRR